ncbi:MAG: ABC transporter ATP-binding protein [Propionibacteriaceae bacterium]|jgi:peptide/nickel transport system ATP-binding protein|nr:ABC transporter ATP-binding protein [Propionibacteriaceae bacterium]
MTETAPAPAGAAAAPVVLAADHVTKQFRVAGGKLTAVDDVSVEFREGQVLAVVGESGSGKSTLARMLLRLLPVTSGAVLYRGRDITRIKGADLRRYWHDVQAVFQDPFASFNQFFTVGHMLRRSLQTADLGGETAEQRIERCLGYVGLKPEDAVYKYPHQLSGGQRQRVMITRALLVDPKVLVADEATSMLDASLRVSVLNVLQDLRRDLGLTVLFITHDIGQACYFADQVVVMEHGQVVEHGPTDDVIFNPQHSYTKRLLADVPNLKGSLKSQRLG